MPVCISEPTGGKKGKKTTVEVLAIVMKRKLFQCVSCDFIIIYMFIGAEL